MRILLSNDDGVHAPGIRALAEELSALGQIEVIAPDRNRSGASNSLTLTLPLKVHQLDNGYYSVDGTPTDCVHLGITGFLQSKVDMVVSGINDGANLGDDVLYSGTVAAAMEGRFLGLPALAVSLVGENVKHFKTAALITCSIIKRLHTHQLPGDTIFNINVPDLPFDKIRGIEVTRLGKRHQSEPVIKAQDARGRSIYWIAPPGAEADAGPGTDFNAISRGFVSITPLHVDMTHYKAFDQVSTWMDEINWSSSNN